MVRALVFGASTSASNVTRDGRVEKPPNDAPLRWPHFVVSRNSWPVLRIPRFLGPRRQGSGERRVQNAWSGALGPAERDVSPATDSGGSSADPRRRSSGVGAVEHASGDASTAGAGQERLGWWQEAPGERTGGDAAP